MENKNSRFFDSLAAKFKAAKRADCAILKASSDVGVRRNKGRNGARFAPDAIVNTLKKMNDHLSIGTFASIPVSFQKEEKENYDEAMAASKKRITEVFAGAPSKVVHLGGGHDHALPLLLALDESFNKNILIVNFDAHCDTRIDDESHSGTPFRDFDSAAKNKFHLAQVGIHDFANSKKTMSALERNQETIIFADEAMELAQPDEFVDRIFSSSDLTIDKNTILFISVDCDAISSSVMSAVSAVNHNGLDPRQLLGWIDVLKDFPCEQKVLGLYEYNPIYDDLSQKGARYLAGLIYQYLR